MEAEAGELAHEILVEKEDPCLQTNVEGAHSEGETLAYTTTEVKAQQFCSGEIHGQPVLVEEEPCKCKCKQSLMQAMEISRVKAAALEEVNKKSSETLKSQVLAWENERERLLELMSDLENNSNAKDGKVKGLQEKLSMAECAIERLTKSRVELQEEVSRMQLEMGQTHNKLTELECVAASLKKTKENEVGCLAGALQAKGIAFEKVQADLADKERLIDELSTQLSNLQDVQQQYTLLQQECSIKKQDLQTLSDSQKGSKHHLQAVVEGHKREMDDITRKLQEALDSHASKDSKIEALTSELHGLQLALKNVQAFNTKADLESCKLKEDLAMAKEAQNSNLLSLEKAVKEVAALREALIAKDDFIASLKTQQINNEKSHQQKRESLEEELQKYKSMEKELQLILEQEQRKVTALEDLRKKDLEAAKIQEICWRDEREKLIMDVSSMHNLIKSMEIYAQEREEKLSRADDAIRHVTESRDGLKEEVSDLRMQIQNLQMQLRDTESALELLEKGKGDELVSLSDLLQVKLRDLEVSQQEVVQHQKTITDMAADLVNLQNLQEESAFFKEALKIKEEEVHALSSSQERSRLQLKALQDEYSKDHDDLLVQLEKALECKARTEKNLEEYQNELGCLRVAMDKANVSRTESEAETEKLLDNLARLQEENFTLQHNLHLQVEHSKNETEALQESVSRKENGLKELKQQIADLEATLSHAMQKEQQWQDGVAECEALRCELKEKCLLHSELYELHQKASLQWSEKENAWLTEMESLNSRAQMAEENLTATNGKLQTAHSNLQCLILKCEECEKKTAAYENEIALLHLKLDESNSQLQSKEQEFQDLQDKLHSTSSTFTVLLQEKDCALSDVKKKLDELQSEVLLRSNENIQSTDQIEFFEKEMHRYEAKIRDLEEGIAHLKKSLLEKAEELSGATEMKEAIEANLSDTREELRLAKTEFELQKQVLKDTMSASEKKLQQALETMHKKEEEMEALLTSLENKDSDINELKTSNMTLLEEKEVLKQSVNAARAKVEMLTLAIENEKSASQQLCSDVEEKDRTIASRSEEVRDLQHTLKDTMSASEKKLQQTLESMQKKEEEMEALLTCLENKDSAINELKTSNMTLLEEKEVLKQSVNASQAKVEMLALAIENEKSALQQLCSVVEEKDRTIASRSEEVRDLQHLLDISKLESQKVNVYEEKLRNLEAELAEASVSLHEKEERLIASEWAVQQLANEVAKAKSSLVQKEREEVLLQSRLSDMETRSKAKERELVEVDCYVQSLVKKNSHKQSEIERLTQAVEKFKSSANDWGVERQELMSEIGQIGIMLQDKIAELAHLEEQLKQRQVRENMMEDAIQGLKSQLADQALLLDEQESKSKQLVHDLETAHTKEGLMAASFKEAEGKLQQADQRFRDETEKLKTNLLETQEKLSSYSAGHSSLERDLLAALEEIEVHKGKLCSLSEIAASKDSYLKELNCKLDTLQEELVEQKKLINQRNEELECTKEELECYTDKERRLIEENCLLTEKMQEQKETLTNHLSIVGAEMLLKDEEIQHLKENMQLMTTEREALNGEVTKLRKELNSSAKTVSDREEEITRLKEARKNLKAELVKVREDMLIKEDALESTLAKLNTAEKKCLALENKIKFLEGQVGKTNSLNEINSHLKEELEEMQSMLKASNTQSKSALDILNSKLDDHCRKETAMEAQAAVLLKKMREMLHLSRQHEAEGIQPLIKESLAILAQSCNDENTEIEFSGMVLGKGIELSEQVQSMWEKSELHGPEMILALQTVMQELQTEEQRRRKIEASVVEMTRNVVFKLAAKEQEIQGLIVELDCLKMKEEDWRKWHKEVLSAQLELENEVSTVMTLIHPGEAQLQSSPVVSSLQAGASVTDMNQLNERWKFIINAYKDCALSITRFVREEVEEVASSSCEFSEGNGALLYSDSWAQELQHEFTQLKQIMKMLLQEAHQKDSTLADAVKTVERLRSSLQEEAEKEKDAQEQVSILQLSLRNSQIALNVGHETIQQLNTSSMNSHIEIESHKGAEGEATSTENVSLRSQLGRASLLAEELNRHIKSRAKETDAELARWREEAERALNLNNDFTDQVAELELRIRSFEEKEQCMGGDLGDARAKLEALEDEISSLRLQLREAAEKARHLELQVDTKEEELGCVQAQMNNLILNLKVVTEKNQDFTVELAKANKQIDDLGDVRAKLEALEDETSKLKLQLKEAAEEARHLELRADTKEEELGCVQAQMNDLRLHLKVVTEKNQDFTVELAKANEQIDDLNRKVGHLEEELTIMQLSLEEWKERASLAHNKMLDLQSEFTAATQISQQGMERIEAEKHCLQLELQNLKERAELSTKDNNLLRLQLEDLQKRLETAENAKKHFQNSCQRLEADLVCAQDASRQREKLLGDALTKLQEGSQHSRIAVEARLQVLYNAMIHEDNDDDCMAAQLRHDHSDADKDEISFINIGCQINDLKSSRATIQQRAMDDDDGCSKNCASFPLLFGSELSPVEGGQGSKESQHELDHYLELCDSLIRRHARLEKQLDNLVTSTSGGNQYIEGSSGEAGMEEEVGESENKKKRLLTTTGDWQGKGGTRKPLQPIPILSQVAVATTPSPCAKRRRSNNGISNSFQDQNSSQ